MASLTEYIKGLQNDYAKNNIYSQLGSGVLGADVNIRGGSPWTNLATNFVKGLIGGGLNEYGGLQNRQYNAGINSVLQDTLAGSPIRAVDGVSEGELGDITNSVSLFKRSQQEDLKNAGLAEFFRNKGALDAQLEAEKEFRKSTLGDAGPISENIDSTIGSPGRQTLEDKRRAAVFEGRSMGITKGDLNEYANSKLKLESKDTERALKDLAAKREMSRQLDEISAEADMAIKKAGNTGGLGAGVKRFGDSVLSIIPGLGDAADQRMAGDTLLDSLAQKGIALNRVAGSGALSDFESRALFDAFLSKNKTPEQNAAILDKIVRTKTVNDEYLNFKENWINTFGSDQGSDVAWQGYKKVAPILVPNQQGELQFNPMRRPWQEFDLNELELLGRSADQEKPLGSSGKSIPTPPAGYELTGKIDANGNYGIRKIR